MPQLRIALSLPGEASLGAFQAGAVCALLVGLGRVNEEDGQAARIDVITGASSGSLTAVLAARALLAGQDPVASLRRAWVTEPSLDALRGRDGLAPLSLERAREVAREELAREHESPPSAQRTGVTVELALAALRGFNYEVPRRQGGRHARRRDPLPATSYLDWWRHRFEPGGRGFTPEWAAAVDAAVASASHPAAFAPVALDRSGEREAYLRHGVENLPPELELWYTDGGLVDREPLGRCLALARAADADAHGEIHRMLLLVEPDVDVAPGGDSTAWAGGGAAPSWTATLSRALRVIVSHSLYEDLRRVEKTNNRIVWTERLAAALAPLLADEERARAVLGRALEEMAHERLPWRRGGDDGAPSSERRDAADAPLEALLARAFGTAAGLASKVPVDVEVVTAQRSELAGESLFQFGGFLAERLRAQDFLVGYANMLAWMEGPGGLEAAGLPAPLALAAGEVVRARARDIPGWVGGAGGRRRIPLATRVRLVQVGLRAARIGLRGARSRGGRT